MARLDKDMGGSVYDDILAGPHPHPLVGSVKLADSQGVLERGTIVIGEPGGEFRAIDKAPTNAETGYILCEDTDTGTDDAVVGFVYKTGNFIRDRLKTDGTFEMTAKQWDQLRGIGIFTEELH